MSKGGGSKAPPPAAKSKNPEGSAGWFTGGFDPYPMQGFNLAPPQNFWQGNNFMTPGITGGQPMMNSNLMSQFPQLAALLGGISPHGADEYSPQLVGGISARRVGDTTGPGSKGFGVKKEDVRAKRVKNREE